MMGLGVTELLIVAGIVLLLFGTTKLRNLGKDLGSAIKGFKSAMSEDDKKSTDSETKETSENLQLQADEPIASPADKSRHVKKEQA